jgi:hypothetical protein
MPQKEKLTEHKHFEGGLPGQTFGIPEREFNDLPSDITAFIYRTCCKDCKNKTKKIDILGKHCSINGPIKIKNKKCAMKK